jgi:hypothetical protein
MSQLNPAAHRSAILALEAQRAAYQRYARMVETQQVSLGAGDADRLTTFADHASRELIQLEQGAQRLEPQLELLRGVAAPEEMQDIRRMLDDLAKDARLAQLSIQNLTAQLEAWRDEYGRQLGTLGVALPGTDEPRPAYVPASSTSFLLDRKG